MSDDTCEYCGHAERPCFDKVIVDWEAAGWCVRPKGHAGPHVACDIYECAYAIGNTPPRNCRAFEAIERHAHADSKGLPDPDAAFQATLSLAIQTMDLNNETPRQYAERLGLLDEENI